MNRRTVLSELRELRRTVRGIEQGCERLIERLESEPKDEAIGWIDQRDSDLGPKRHCALVRRRIEHEKAGARIIGRRHLLSPEAYAEESDQFFGPGLSKAHAPAVAAAPSPDNDNDNDEARAVLHRLARKMNRS